MAGDDVPPGRGEREQLLWAADACLHTVPRAASDPEEIGSFTLFRPHDDAHPYYARPRPGAAAPTEADLERLDRRCGELGLPLAVQWVADRAPGLAELCRGHGLTARLYPMLTLAALDPLPRPLTGPAPDAVGGVDLEVLEPGSPLLPAVLATTMVAFASPGTAGGPEGVAERRTMEALLPAGRVDAARARVSEGTTVVVVARVDGEVVAGGQYQQAGGCAEISSVATLPAFRRRGLAPAVTGRLVTHARDHAVTLVLLVATDATVVPVYERLGFSGLGLAGQAAR